MLLDDLVADQRDTLRALLRFLEVEPRARAADHGREAQQLPGPAARAPRSARRTRPCRAATRAALTEQYAESNARLAEFLGRDLSAWQRV